MSELTLQKAVQKKTNTMHIHVYISIIHTYTWSGGGVKQMWYNIQIGRI